MSATCTELALAALPTDLDEGKMTYTVIDIIIFDIMVITIITIIKVSLRIPRTSRTYSGPTRFCSLRIPEFSGLQVLNMSLNNLKALQNNQVANAGLVNLQKLYLSQNQLRELQEHAFYKMNNLVELDLSFNKLGAVPTNAFKHLMNLRQLLLKGLYERTIHLWHLSSFSNNSAPHRYNTP